VEEEEKISISPDQHVNITKTKVTKFDHFSGVDIDKRQVIKPDTEMAKEVAFSTNKHKYHKAKSVDHNNLEFGNNTNGKPIDIHLAYLFASPLVI
jgi:hypothetical protein